MTCRSDSLLVLCRNQVFPSASEISSRVAQGEKDNCRRSVNFAEKFRTGPSFRKMQAWMDRRISFSAWTKGFVG